MQAAIASEPTWYQAMTLTERAGAGHARHDGAPSSEDDRGDRRFRHWRSQAPFPDPDLFGLRLAADRLSEQDLRDLLREDARDVGKRFPVAPAWLERLAAVFARPAPVPPAPAVLPDPRSGDPACVAAQVVAHGCAALVRGADELAASHGDPPFDRQAVAGVLLPSLLERLSHLLSRTVALEVNVARVQGRLAGDTAEERFRDFLRQLDEGGNSLALLREYPVLARLLVTCVDRWVESGLELLGRLCADWPAIRATLAPGRIPGRLVAVDADAGDLHRGGRAVSILAFASGFRLVYKPRSLAVEAHFQDLLAWLNARVAEPRFRTIAVLDRGAYGWAEFVSPGDCATKEEVERFYRRQGGYLALLHALHGKDFYCENVIAAGEHPVLVDLETLFHPEFGRARPARAEEIAHRRLAASVIGTGLLPRRLWSEASSPGIDLSGLGAPAGQLTPSAEPAWEGAGTDTMRLCKRRVVRPGARNLPTLNGADVDATAYADEIENGFRTVFQTLVEHRRELLAEDGPVFRFAPDEVRVILRDTRVYATLLQDSLHPDVLRDALDRDRLFDRLWTGARLQSHLARAIPAEREDLALGDVPIFTGRPESRDLWTGAGERLADFLDEPGMTLVERRLRGMDRDDLETQVWIIRASLMKPAPHPAPRARPRGGRRAAGAAPERRRLLAAATAVGERLATLAVRGEHDASWIGLLPTRHRYWVVGPLGPELYDGVAGVVLFLAYLGAITREPAQTELARLGLATLRRQLHAARSSLPAIGGFAGWGGLIYALSHLGALWDDVALLEEAARAVDQVAPRIETDEDDDVAFGAAGLVGGLISLYACDPTDAVLAAAIRCGDRLIARARPLLGGLGWPTAVGRMTTQAASPSGGAAGAAEADQGVALTGFAHGAAGIAWALATLFGWTGEERFREAARGAARFETSHLDRTTGNWRAHLTAGGADMVAWCYGAPGIGLSRLAMLEHLDDDAVLDDIATALATTAAEGFGHNHSLCHGDLGNVDVFLQAHHRLVEPRWGRQAARLGGTILESIGSRGRVCGNPPAVESPGLMTGIAGMGYQLLRLAEPGSVPSVLALEPPLG